MIIEFRTDSQTIFKTITVTCAAVPRVGEVIETSDTEGLGSFLVQEVTYTLDPETSALTPVVRCHASGDSAQDQKRRSILQEHGWLHPAE